MKALLIVLLGVGFLQGCKRVPCDCGKEKFYYFYLGMQSGLAESQIMTQKEIYDELFVLEKMLMRKSEGLEDWEIPPEVP